MRLATIAAAAATAALGNASGAKPVLLLWLHSNVCTISIVRSTGIRVLDVLHEIGRELCVMSV